MTDGASEEGGPDGSDRDRSVADAPAAVHRELGDAGVSLNEAHAHLSALRTARREDSDAAAEIAAAEAEALVSTLEDAREELDEAIEHARLASQEYGEGPSEPPQREERDGDGTDDDPPDMLWNTVYHGRSSGPLGPQ